MKNIVYIFLLFTSICSFGQNRHEQISQELKTSIEAKDIINIKKGLGNRYKEFKAYFRFIPSIHPLNPKITSVLSSDYGLRFHTLDKKYKKHEGIDIAAEIGTPIHATASGTIKKTGKSKYGYGNEVLIDHLFGYSTRYAHMYLFVVKKGFRVKKGDIIGYVGNTGKSTGPHIHYEILKYEINIDPIPYINLKL